MVSYLLYSTIKGAMNTQVCTATKKTPYELVFGQEPCSNFALMKELYDQGIRNEEDIPDNVTVQSSENVREGLGESIVLNDSAASNDEDNDESRTDDIDVPESESAPTPSYVMSTNHEEFRKVATENVKKSIERMRAVVESRKRQITFSVGELVRINIPRIDRAGIDRRSLPCKVLEALDNGYYRLGCASGVLDKCYLASEMEGVSAEFPELENIPSAQISLMEASRLQSSAASVNALCHCKSGCVNNRCACRRAGVACSSRCHLSRNCTNHDV